MLCVSSLEILGMLGFIMPNALHTSISSLHTSFSSGGRFVAAASAAVARPIFYIRLGFMAKLRPFSRADCSTFARMRMDVFMTFLTCS